MKRQVVCKKCSSVLEYDDKSVWLGNRDYEDILCPICRNIVDTIFTDQISTVRIIKKSGVDSQ